MKIKTIWNRDVARFNHQVNQALDEGYILGRQDVLTDNSPAGPAFYAEMILPDLPTPGPVDPDQALQALHQIRDFCQNTEADICKAALCPLYGWCDRYAGKTDPADWDLPGEVDE